MHINVYTHPYIEHCYGSEMDVGLYLTTPAAWPFVRLFFSGAHFAVMLFFTISGYVICMRLLTLLHEGRTTEFVEALNSAVVRRPLRLYLPVFWSTLFLVFFWNIFNIATPFPPREDGLFWELISWVRETGKFCDFYRMGALFTYYNGHTWTIPVELRGSMYLFVWLFALHQVDNRVRILMQAVMVLFLVLGSPAAWYGCFFAGMLTAELDLLANAAPSLQMAFPWDGALRALRKRKMMRQILLHAMMLFGFYLGGQPSGNAVETQEQVLGSCPGWITLNKMIPSSYQDKYGTYRWFWLFWGAWMVVVSVKETWAKALFETRFSQCKSSLFLP
jgi:peptidoglycan/LPS O-acetylase OafA/YrhL